MSSRYRGRTVTFVLFPVGRLALFLSTRLAASGFAASARITYRIPSAEEGEF
ncbi:MAG: hypothetical protein ACP5TI_03380 [Thermoprotei archaeon]